MRGKILGGLIAVMMCGTMVAAEEIRVGDVYRCAATRADLPSLQAVVGVVETLKRGAAVHVHIPAVQGIQTIGHVPFAAEAMVACTRVATGQALPDPAAFREGYDLWRDAYEQGQAGIFTVNPADAYLMIMGVLDPSRGAQG